MRSPSSMQNAYPDQVGSTLADTGRIERLRRLGKWRRRAGWLLLAGPMLAAVLLDLGRRGERVLEFEGYYRATYLGAALESLILWAALLYAASRRRGIMRWVAAVLFVLAITFSFGGQQYFFEQYSAYLNVDVSRFASNFSDSIVNQLVADIGNYLRAKLPPLLAAAGLVWVGRRWLRPRRRPAMVAVVVAPLLLLASFFIPTQHRHQQASTPDVLYLQAVGGLIRTQLGLTEQSNQLRPRARQSLPVPPLTPRKSKPNVLFFILESVRADAVCVEPEPGCELTPYTSKLLPDRHPLTELRALDSSTAISLAVLWAGLGPDEDRDTLHTWPLIFDYARAAGYDTAFWTSQNMLFGNSRLWVKNLGVSQFISATDLDPTADLDIGAPEHLLAGHVNAHVGKLREPFLAVVQLSNVHYPYQVDPNGPQPFQPSSNSKNPDTFQEFKNHYLNSVHQQDRHVANMIRHLRSTAMGKRTVIVYTSDHAEAFREHGQTGHTFSVFDEEVKVPGFIDVPPGLLSEREEKNLAAKRHAFTFHPDLAATILDVMGVWSDPGVEKYKSKIVGVSLLADEPNQRPLPLTNCAGVWSCAFENWGYMQGSLKLHARSWDDGWSCFDLATDPLERHDLGTAHCKKLEQLAIGSFGRLPGQGVTKPGK